MGWYSGVSGLLAKAKMRVPSGDAVATQMARMGGFGTAHSGYGAKALWRPGSVAKSMGINAAAGGAYGGLTDSDDRGGGAMRGAMTGMGMGLAGRGAMSVYASRRQGSEGVRRMGARFGPQNLMQGPYNPYRRGFVGPKQPR
jgi:hypothetical protein